MSQIGPTWVSTSWAIPAWITGSWGSIPASGTGPVWKCGVWSQSNWKSSAWLGWILCGVVPPIPPVLPPARGHGIYVAYPSGSVIDLSRFPQDNIGKSNV